MVRRRRPRPNRKKVDKRIHTWNFLQWMTIGLRVTAATLAVSRRGAPDAPAQAFNPITLITGDK